MNSSKSDFTQGSILGKLLPFMLPILGALVLQAAYGAVDLLVVGRFGTTSGLSAVSTGSQVLNLVTFVITQFAMGITVLIARYIGEKKPQYIGAFDRLGATIYFFAIVFAVLFCSLDRVLHSRLQLLMQAPQEAVGTDIVLCAYLRWRNFFSLWRTICSQLFFRGLGDSKSPLLFVAVACVVNIAGDLILVAGLHLDCSRSCNRNC